MKKQVPIRRFAIAAGALAVMAGGTLPASAQRVGSRDYGPMIIGDWLFTPQLTAGGIYNDNVFSRRTNKTGSLGTTFSATGFAARDDGISKTNLYFRGQADVYPDQSRGNSFTGAVGANHERQFGQDILFNGGVEIARLQNSLRSQALTPGSLGLSNANYTQFQANLSLRKTFNRFYVEGGTSGSTQVYDKSSATTADKNGWSGVVRGRLGYEVSPAVSVYAEPSVNLQRYNTSFYDTNVYKSVVGVSFPRFGLFSGDVYGGYMWANYPNAVTSKWEHAPTLGGSVSWLPTADITVTLAVSQSFGLNGPNQNNAFSVINGIAGAITAADPLTSAATANALANQLIAATNVNQQLFASAGSQTKSSTVSLGGRYVVNALTNAGLTVSYQNTSRSGVTVTPTSDVLMARLSIDYQVWANWGVSGTYSFARVIYNQPGLSYSQNVVTLGVSGRL